MLDNELAQRNEMSAVDAGHSVCNFNEPSHVCVYCRQGGKFQVNSCFVYLSHDHATQEMELMQAVFMS